MLRRTIISFVFVCSLYAGESTRARISGVDSVGITVSDLERAVDFYTGVLTFEKIAEYESAGQAYEHLTGVFGARSRTARLRLGDEFLELTEYLAPQGRPVPLDFRSNDRWFQHVAIIVSDMEAAYRHLRKHKVRHASSGPQRLPDWNPNAGGIQAFYFRDPDGHHLEILSFPEGKGDPKWRGSFDRLFLGIDHTAIVIQDTEASLRFYRDTLGMRVAGESENYGPEQERLNHVFGARLRITALRGPSGPGVELLEYLTPTDGRPYPVDARSNDLIHWQTKFPVANADAIAESLRKVRARFVSNGIIDAPDANASYRKAFLARDPDGHAVQIIEQ